MINDLTTFNIREYLNYKEDENLGEDELKRILSDFSCERNPGVERFFKEQAINFTKKNQSVTYLVFSNGDDAPVGFFTLAIKPINVYGGNFSNTLKRKLARVSEWNEEKDIYTLSAYLIAQLGKNFANGMDERISGTRLVEAALDIIKELQYMIGGIFVYLEAADNENLIAFYEEKNGFRRFDKKETNSTAEEPKTLIRFLKTL